ncbi:hypothetical protein BDY24DRAFT_393478 [Mrakia frigida]|uniref:uncharacterized protein n=1 Tax=Mrakia frigida TaxID=29902 RepID=UPI003FCC00C2
MSLPSSLSPSKTRNFSPPTSTISPPTTSLSPFAPPAVAQFTPSPHLFVQDRKITSSLRDEDDARARWLMLQEEEIHSAARRLRRRLPKKGCELEKAGALLKLEGAFIRGKPLITSTRTLLFLDPSLSLSTPLDPIPRPAVLAVCSDVLVLGLKVRSEEEKKLYFDWRLEGQRIIKLARCEVEEDPTTKVITLSTPLTTLYLHPSSSLTSSSLYQTLLQHLDASHPTTSLPPTPPVSPACSIAATSLSATPTSPTSPTSPLPQARPKRAVPPSSFHSRPLSQISSHSATSTTSISSIRSVSSFRSDWQPVWVKDDECAGCMVCGETWSWRRRRHHCRACGRLICHECSSFRPSIFGSVQPMRSCTTCSAAMDRDSDDDEEEEFGHGHVGLRIYGEEEEGSDEEGTVRGGGGSERGEDEVDPDEESVQEEGGSGRVREEDEDEEVREGEKQE